MKYTTFIILLIFSSTSFSQTSKNIDLVSQVPNEVTGNDVWGFKHSLGMEFAIMGDDNSTRIFSLENPESPTLIADIEGTNSPWRDIKNFGNYLYVVADRGSDGLLIIDLNTPFDDIQHKFFRPGINLGIVDTLNTCHNIFVNDDGYAYLSGCNLGVGGVIIFDLNQDPWNPTYVGIEDFRYAHDVFVRDTFMYASEIYEGQFGVYSVADKSNPKLLGTSNTPNFFTHNAWSSDDHKYLFTTDERGESFVGAYDISNLSDIKFLDKFKPIDGVSAIPHNTHFKDDYIFTSWYTEGVVICDVSRPENIVEVAYYDTFEGPSGGFSGCWGAYPFLPSGLLLASDRQNGLFVLRPTLVRASYLEGTITSNNSDQPLSGVSIKILSEDRNSESTDGNGVYKTGQCTPGEFDVFVSHPEFNDTTVTITLVSGEVTELDLSLTKIPVHSLTINTMDESGQMVDSVAIVFLSDDDKNIIIKSGSDGLASTMIQQGQYRIVAAKWGFKQADFGLSSILNDDNIDITLKAGYEDDFIFDQGWESTSIASSGEWVRGEPIGTKFDTIFANVDQDLPLDFGNSCYMTGNAGGQGGTDDVDNGVVSLLSKVIDLSTFEDPYLHYYTWYVDVGGDVEPNDSLTVFLYNGMDSILLETIKRPNQSGRWIKSEFALDSITDSTQVQLLVIAQDDIEAGHIVEAGFDGFKITEGETSPEENIELVSSFKLFPNPVASVFTLQNSDRLPAEVYNIFDISGRWMKSGVIQNTNTTIDISDVSPGTYFINVRGKGFQQSIKLVKI